MDNEEGMISMVDVHRMSLPRIKRHAVGRLVKAERLKEKGVWPRELAILNRLYPKYPSPSFWVNADILDFDGCLNSLAFLVNGRGAECLAAAWARFHFAFPAPAPQTALVDAQPATPYHREPAKPDTTAGFLIQGPEVH